MTVDLVFKRVPYADPDAQALVAAVQEEYTALYGSPDEGPLDGDGFEGTDGAFFLAYRDDEPIATAAWRRLSDTRAEIKRMYIAPRHRGQGYARWLLGALEDAVRAAGITEIVLETGLRQPAAIALYRAAGYVDVEAFGYYADDPLSMYLGKALR